MRHISNSRIITVNKETLIKTIKENKARHIEEYKIAVAAYREEAKRQLEEQLQKLAEGNLDIKIHLTSPIDKSDEYDKLVKMFEWEVKTEVDLTTGEFNDYVHDELDFAISAKFANTMYSIGGGSGNKAK